MATQLDRIELGLTNLAADIAALRSLMQQTLAQEISMANNLDTLNAALAALNTATTQEASLLQADTAKLDAIQALITDLVNTAGVPQSVLDTASRIQEQLTGIVASTTAQAARLDQLATDPRDPVPVPPPPAPAG